MTTATETETRDIRFTADVEIRAAAGDGQPRLSILAYSGGLMDVAGFGPLVIDLAGLERPPQVPILADHQAALPGIVGHGEATVTAGRLVVEGRVAGVTEASKQIVELARSGFKFQASVGVQMTRTDRIKDGAAVTVNGKTIKATGGGFLFVKAGKLKEVSIVAVGADSGTSVSVAATEKGNTTMTTTAKSETEIRAEERQRIGRIEALCRPSVNGWGSHQPHVDELKAKAIEGEITIEAMQAELLGILRGSRGSGPFSVTGGGGPGIPSRDIMASAVLAHMGRDNLAAKHFGGHAAQRARDLRATSLIDLCRASLQADGVTIPMGRMELVRAALSGGSLPVALGDAANKLLLETYMESPATWRAFAAVKPAVDFKEHTGIRPSALETLAPLPAGGALDHVSLAESTYVFKVATFGRILTVSRQDIINDDLGLFDTTAQAFGRAAARSVADKVYEVLLANTGSFFSAGNGNLATGGGSALATIALGTGIAAMLAQRDANDYDLDIRPKTLLVPPELRHTAIALLESDFLAVTAGSDEPTGNYHKNSLVLAVEPRLSNSDRFTGTSTTAWYLFGSPADAAMIVGFLQGQQTPTVEFFGLQADPNTLAVSWRVYHDFGAALADFRGAYKADGA